MAFEGEPLRIGLIGCGGMGLRHARAVAEMQANGCHAVEIVAICDTDPARRAALSKVLAGGSGRAPTECADERDLLDLPAVEAVLVVLPTALHHAVALRALDAGKHVLLEKPMALTVAACDLVVSAAERSGRVVAVAENFRRIPHNRAIGALFADGTLGEVNAMVVRNLTPLSQPAKPGATAAGPPQWYTDRLRAGGFHALEMGVHEADLQHFWFGPVQTVSAELRTFADTDANPSISEDMLTASFTFAGGMTSHIVFCSTLPGGDTADRVAIADKAVARAGAWHAWQDGEVRFADGTTRPTDTIVADWLTGLDSATRRHLLPPGAWHDPAGGSDPTEPLSYGVGLALHDFADAVRTGRAPEIGPEIGRRAVATCCAIRESALSRRPVAVADVLSGAVAEAQAPIDRALGLVPQPVTQKG